MPIKSTKTTKKVVAKKPIKKATKKSAKKAKLLGQIDLVFIIDSTGSMGMYIEEAKKHAVSIMNKIQKDADLDIQVALVAYRDHPPQDNTFVTQVHDFMPTTDFQQVLNPMEAAGGGDWPEAVYDAVWELNALEWRENSDRLVYLIGDAPPHKQCLCGISVFQLAKMLEEQKIELNAHSIANNPETSAAFEQLSKPTGGKLTIGNHAADMTHAYSGALVSHGTLVSDSRAFVGSAAGAGVSYTSAAALSDSDILVIANSAGMLESDAKTTVAYLSKRGL